MAEAAGDCGDFARRLTLRGQLQARQAGRALRQQPQPPAVVVSSPAHRATETAEGMVAELHPAPRLEVADILYAGGPWEALLEAIPDLATADVVALVSHMPFVEHLARELLAESAELRFYPSAVYALDFPKRPEPGAGTLAWTHHPAES